MKRHNFMAAVLAAVLIAGNLAGCTVAKSGTVSEESSIAESGYLGESSEESESKSESGESSESAEDESTGGSSEVAESSSAAETSATAAPVTSAATAYEFMRGLSDGSVKTMSAVYSNDELKISDEIAVEDKAIISALLSAAKALDVKEELPEGKPVYCDAFAGMNYLTFTLNDGTELCIELVNDSDNVKYLKCSHTNADGDSIEPSSMKYCDFTPLFKAETEKLVPIIKNGSVKNTAEDGSKLVTSRSDNDRHSDKYKANCPGDVCAKFVLKDKSKVYRTSFACWIDKQAADGSWSRVKPLGEIDQDNDTDNKGHVWREGENGREAVFVDLACYPLLSAGRYRIVKPFWEEGSSDCNQYEAYYRFEMVDGLNTGDKVKASVRCTKSEYPINADNIGYILDYTDNIFTSSVTYNIERKENGKWVSARTGKVETNSISCMGWVLVTEGDVDEKLFDLSKAGEYRIRISVGEIDESMDFVENYDTVYAYFKMVENAEISSLTAKSVKDEHIDIDRKFEVEIKNDSGLQLKLKKAEIVSGGKAISCEYSKKTIYSKETLKLSAAENLPVGNPSLKLTFSADASKDTVITVPLKVRKATEEGKSTAG